MKYKPIILILIFLICGMIVSEVSAPRGVKVSETYYTGSMFGVEIVQNVTIPAGNISVKTRYTSTINIDNWKITDNKDIQIYLSVLVKPKNIDLWVEHMHCDCFIESTNENNGYFDGILQDTMDDKYHSGGVYGFYINETIDYAETFSIEGYSDYLVNYWSYWNTMHETRDALDENDLKWYGCYGCSFRIIFDVVFKGTNQSADYLSKFIVEDNLLLDLEKGWVNNEGDQADQSVSTSNGFDLFSIIFLGCLVISWRKVRKGNKV